MYFIVAKTALRYGTIKMTILKKIIAIIFFVFAAIVYAESDTIAVKPNQNAPSFLPRGKNWKLVWSDEFNGTELDQSKWNFRLFFWGTKFKAFTDKGVEVKDGSLRLHIVKNPDGTYSSPHLQTGSLIFDIPAEKGVKFWPFGKRVEPKFMHRFGYYEIKCRFPKNDGWHAAFWLQAPGAGTHPDPSVAGMEIDIMENYKLYSDNKIICGPLWDGYGKDGKRCGHFHIEHKETPDKWHYYGVDWKVDGYDYYIDGKLVGSTTIHKDKATGPTFDKQGCHNGGVLHAPVSHVEQFILVSTEVHGYRYSDRHDPILDKIVLPDYFEVDHIRVYDDVNLNPGVTVDNNKNFNNQTHTGPDLFKSRQNNK